MNKLLAAFTLLLALALAGCSAQPSQSEAVGDQPRHIQPSQCDAPSRRVIDQEKLTEVHSCSSEAVTLEDGTSAHYVLITYGPGMDCPSGCIYEWRAAMVMPNRIALLPQPFVENRGIHERISGALKIALPDDFLKHADRRFAERNGKWQMVLTFQKYLNGTVVVHPDRNWETGVEIHATPAGILTADELQPKVWPEFLAQCQPPVGAQAHTGFDLRPNSDGSWAGTLVWGVGEKYSKIPLAVSPSGQITFPQGCGKDRVK